MKRKAEEDIDETLLAIASDTKNNRQCGFCERKGHNFRTCHMALAVKDKFCKEHTVKGKCPICGKWHMALKCPKRAVLLEVARARLGDLVEMDDDEEEDEEIRSARLRILERQKKNIPPHSESESQSETESQPMEQEISCDV
jgi:hypothetical protein